MSVVALDYDGTYTAMPAVWDRFIEAAQNAGHRVVCVTMRHPTEPVNVPCEVIYTSRQAKLLFTQRLGLTVNIWIDDMPELPA